MNKPILLDMDGVIADFNAAAIALHNPTSHQTFIGWNPWEQWGLTASDFWTPMGYDFWFNVPKTINANRIVQMCEIAVGQKNVCFLSSPCDTHGCLDGKRAWIKKHFPKYSRQFLIGPAKHFCAHNNSLLVDDSDRNCEDFAKAGGCVCLYPQPWNKARGNVPIAVEVLAKSLADFVGER